MDKGCIWIYQEYLQTITRFMKKLEEEYEKEF